MPDLETKVDPQSSGSEQESANGADAESLDRDESTSDQPEEEGIADGDIGPENLPPELEDTRKQLFRDYHAKTQKLKEDRLRLESSLKEGQTKSETLQKLFLQPWFTEALAKEKARRAGHVQEPVEIADDEFEAARSDKKAFTSLVSRLAERIVSGKVAPELGSAKQAVQELKTEREFDEVARRYPDFRELNDKGSLAPYLERGYDYETAYQKYQAEHVLPKLRKDLQDKARSTAQDILDEARTGAISKGGASKVRGTQIVKAKNFDDAWDQIMELERRGVKDYKVERIKS